MNDHVFRTARTLPSGALGASLFADLQPGTLVADEFGKLYGHVVGPYISPDPRNYAQDADNLLVIVRLVEGRREREWLQGDEVCISGRFLHPLEHGPLLDDDPEPRTTDLAAWDAWYARRQDLDERRRLACEECGGNVTLWPIETIGRCTPQGHYLRTERAPRGWDETATGTTDADANYYRYDPLTRSYTR